MSTDLDFIIKWNTEYPIDRWWRQKYKVPFNSDTHKSISPQDMLLDFLEDTLSKKILSQMEKKEEIYVPGSRSFITNEISDTDFEDLDIDSIKI